MRSRRSRSPSPVSAPIPPWWPPPRRATAGTGCSTAARFTAPKSLGAKGINAFVVPAGTPGFLVVKPNEDKLGITSWTTSELLFDNCVVPAANRLGYDEAGNQVTLRSGQAAALGALSANRPNMAMMAIALAEASLDIAEPLLHDGNIHRLTQRLHLAVQD